MFVMPGARAKITAAEVAAARRGFTPYTPTVTAFSGSFNTVSARGRFLKLGKLVFFGVEVLITDVGTANGSIIVTLPVPPKNNVDGIPFWVFSGRENGVTGNLMIAFVTSDSDGSLKLFLQKYDGTFLGANGYKPCVSGVYEAKPYTSVAF